MEEQRQAIMKETRISPTDDWLTTPPIQIPTPLHASQIFMIFYYYYLYM